VAGIVVMSYAEICDGKISVQSTGAPGSQAGAHAPVRVGPEYGAGTPANPDPLEGAVGWKVRNLILVSDKLVTNMAYPFGVGAPGVQVYGSANGGLIEDIYIPDSARMLGGVHMDWTPQGPIVSSEASMAANKTAYLAGTGKTLHPTNIDVRRIVIGALTRASTGITDGAFGIRLSGCGGIRVSKVRQKSTTSSALTITAGDLGYEFADAATRRIGMTGIEVDDFEVSDPLGAARVAAIWPILTVLPTTYEARWSTMATPT
jgi:hypothetical protein